MAEEGRREDDRTARLLVRGRVQGVGFRAWTVRRAEALGVRGWVRNRPDGAVEVHAGGSAGAVDRFRGVLREGPGLARVSELLEDGPGRDLPPRGFEIRR